MKTGRFAEVVKAAGAPEPYLLWVAPEKDEVFQRALKAHRVMTVHQENVGTKKDHGSVGFSQERHAEYLVFPKSLKAFEGRKIVGINYALLAEESRPGARPPVSEKKEPAWKRAKKPAPPPREEKVIRFERPAVEAEPEQEEAAEAGEPEDAPTEKKKAVRQATAKPKKAARAAKASSRAGGISMSEVKRAMRELKAGKTVAAYERLQALVARAEEG